MRKRRRTPVLVGFALAVASVLAFASQAGAASFTNACRNSAVGTNWDQINVSLNATAPSSVSPGGTVLLSNINETAAVPSGVFVAGYNLGLLTVGTNTIPATLHSVIDAANTVQGSQPTNNVDTSISTKITDPNGTPGTGDETATDGTASAAFADQIWTAAASGTIGFHEHRDDAVTGAAGGGIIAVAHLAGGALNVQFHCTPGSVAGSSPGVQTFTDGPTLASTQVENLQCKKLQKKLKKARKAKNKAKVKTIRKQLRKLGC